MGWQEAALLHTWGPDPCCSPQCIVVCHPVLVAHVTLVANDLHPLGVLVHHLPCRGGPLLAQSPHIQVLILHCQPLRLEACGGKNGTRGGSVSTWPSDCATHPKPYSPEPAAGYSVPWVWSLGRNCPVLARLRAHRKGALHPSKLKRAKGFTKQDGSSPFPTVPSPSGRITQGTTLLPSIW